MVKKSFISKINLDKSKKESIEIKNRCVKAIFFNNSIDDDYKKNILSQSSSFIDENGFNIETLYHKDENGNRTYHNYLSNKLSNIFDKKEIFVNPLLQPKTESSIFEKINQKYISLGNRDFIKDGHTILVRSHIGQGDYKLDNNIEFLKDVFSSVNYIKNNYSILLIKTQDDYKSLKKHIVDSYKNARRDNKNLIIIYGQKLDTGIDFPEINPDVIINMSKLASNDVAVQVLGRIERANVENGKKFCFFFDFNISNILKSVYQNKSIVKSKTEYEFLIEYKDSIFNISDSKFVESDENYIKDLSIKINELLNTENDTDYFYDRVTSNSIFDDIHYSNLNEKFTSSQGKNEELSGKSKKITKKSSGKITDKTKEEIFKKLKVSFFIKEIFKVYEDTDDSNCKTLSDVIDSILEEDDYFNQFIYNIGKLVNALKINTEDSIESLVDFMVNSIDYSKLNNDLLYSQKIEPLNRSKVNINILFD